MNKNALSIIDRLNPEVDYKVNLEEHQKELLKNRTYGTKGISFKNWLKIIISLFSLTLIGVIGATIFDGNNIAFKYLFGKIERNKIFDDIEYSKYIGNWNLLKPYIIRRDTIQESFSSNYIYYTIGLASNVYMYGVDSTRLGGIEYITNAIYEINTQDTAIVENYFRNIVKPSKATEPIDDIDLPVGRRVETINVVFREIINFKDTTKPSRISREGNLIGRYSPQNSFGYSIRAFKNPNHRLIVDRIITKYLFDFKRLCDMPKPIHNNDLNTDLFQFNCEPVGYPKKPYTKDLYKLSE